MKTILLTLCGFIAGALFGVLISIHVTKFAVSRLSLEAIGEKAVKDVASSYENTLSKSVVFEKLTERYYECVRQNSLLQHQILIFNRNIYEDKAACKSKAKEKN